MPYPDRSLAAPKRKPRADFSANRQKLLDTAAALIAGSGSSVTLEAVAREAGVGIGTLYRHFPTRRALFETLYRSDAEEVCAAAQTLSVTETPVAALRSWLEVFVNGVCANRGLREALSIPFDPDEPIYRDSIARLSTTADDMLAGIREAGLLRSDLSGSTLIRILIGVAQLSGDDGREDVLRRLTDIIVVGITRDAARS